MLRVDVRTMLRCSFSFLTVVVIASLNLSTVSARSPRRRSVPRTKDEAQNETLYLFLC